MPEGETAGRIEQACWSKEDTLLHLGGPEPIDGPRIDRAAPINAASDMRKIDIGFDAGDPVSVLPIVADLHAAQRAAQIGVVGDPANARHAPATAAFGADVKTAPVKSRRARVSRHAKKRTGGDAGNNQFFHGDAPKRARLKFCPFEDTMAPRSFNAGQAF